MSWLRAIVWHPAFAYALVVVLCVPLIVQQYGHRPQESPPVAPQTGRHGPAGTGSAMQDAPPPADGGNKEEGGVHPRAAARLEARPAAPAERHWSYLSGPEQPAENALPSPAGPAPGAAPPGPPAPPPLRRQLVVAAPEPTAQTHAFAILGGTQRGLGERADQPGERRIDLTPDAVITISSPDSALVLRVPVPPGTQAGAELDIRVHSADDRRELRQRLAWDGYDRTVELTLPASWLVPSTYTVTVGVVTPVTTRTAR